MPDDVGTLNRSIICHKAGLDILPGAPAPWTVRCRAANDSAVRGESAGAAMQAIGVGDNSDDSCARSLSVCLSVSDSKHTALGALN